MSFKIRKGAMTNDFADMREVLNGATTTVAETIVIFASGGVVPGGATPLPNTIAGLVQVGATSGNKALIQNIQKGTVLETQGAAAYAIGDAVALAAGGATVVAGTTTNIVGYVVEILNNGATAGRAGNTADGPNTTTSYPAYSYLIQWQ